jgi:hypothetical protein
MAARAQADEVLVEQALLEKAGFQVRHEADRQVHLAGLELARGLARDLADVEAYPGAFRLSQVSSRGNSTTSLISVMPSTGGPPPIASTPDYRRRFRLTERWST